MTDDPGYARAPERTEVEWRAGLELMGKDENTIRELVVPPVGF